jgi:flagellar hook-length control protein FliK
MQERMRVDTFTGKINEPARLAEAQTTEILRQISRQVAGSSGTGSQSIHIQLHPEDLGQIDLRISTSTLGTHITLIPDQSSTGKLLETHIAELKQTLADAGVQMANVHVGQQSQQQSFRDPQYGQNIARQNSGYNSTAHDSVEEVPGARSLSRTSLVDYRI